jgi:Flp pilus assembly protein TadD
LGGGPKFDGTGCGWRARLSQGLQLNPENVEAAGNLGAILFAQGKRQETEPHL